MTYYLYNALDIAAYFKWTSMPADTERVYLDLVFQMRDSLLARPLAMDFESFCLAVYREMYHLWARGFENEFSEVSRIATNKAVTIFCEQRYLPLESYMKLLALHLVMSDNLPYIRINFAGLPLLTGVEGEYVDFERNVALAVEALRLSIADNQGKVVDLQEGLPSDTSRICLSDDFRTELFGRKGYREQRNLDYQQKMRILREASQKDHENQIHLREQVDQRSNRKTTTRPTAGLNETEIIEPVKASKKNIDKKR